MDSQSKGNNIRRHEFYDMDIGILELNLQGNNHAMQSSLGGAVVRDVSHGDHSQCRGHWDDEAGASLRLWRRLSTSVIVNRKDESLQQASESEG